jgi:hypothetical protein
MAQADVALSAVRVHHEFRTWQGTCRSGGSRECLSITNGEAFAPTTAPTDFKCRAPRRPEVAGGQYPLLPVVQRSRLLAISASICA